MAKITLLKEVLLTGVKSHKARESLKDAKCFEVSNVYSGYLMASQESLKTVGLSPISPPFDNMWVEWTDIEPDQDGLRKSQGAQILSKRTESGGTITMQHYFHILPRGILYYINAYTNLTLDNNGVIEDVIFQAGDDARRTHHAQRTIDILGANTANEVARFLDEYKKGIQRKTKTQRESELQYVASIIDQGEQQVRFALALVNAKNVNMVDSEEGKRGKRRRRHKGKRHYTLRIRPSGQRSSRDSKFTDDKNAFHFARGHFKTYTEENPLFGQHIGTYWWEAHARGSKSRGEITKEYEVSPAKEEKENGET